MKKVFKEKSKQYDRSVKQWYNLLENVICRNPKSAKFYGYVNRKLNVQSFMPTLQTQGNYLEHLTNYQHIFYKELLIHCYMC